MIGGQDWTVASDRTRSASDLLLCTDGPRTLPRPSRGEGWIMWIRWISQLSILIPAVLMLVAGFLVAVRSVDVRLTSARGARQLASNLSYTVATVALCLALLMMVQGIVGYNIRSSW